MKRLIVMLGLGVGVLSCEREAPPPIYPNPSVSEEPVGVEREYPAETGDPFSDTSVGLTEDVEEGPGSLRLKEGLQPSDTIGGTTMDPSGAEVIDPE